MENIRPYIDRETYSRIGKARRAAGAEKRGEFPVPGCPIPRCELDILFHRDEGLVFARIAQERNCAVITIKKLAQRTHERVSELTGKEYHDTDDVLQYVKERGWLDEYRRSRNEKVA